MITDYLNDGKRLVNLAKNVFKEERTISRLDGWFLIQELKMKHQDEVVGMCDELKAAYYSKIIALNLPLFVSKNNIFVGTQRDAFAMSYELINPNFTVESFTGYCNPAGVFNDIEQNHEFTEQRINKVKEWFLEQPYVERLKKAYDPVTNYTGEVVFFIEQVTGHTICDFRYVLKYGVKSLIKDINEKLMRSVNSKQKETYQAMIISLEACVILTNRYRELVLEQLKVETEQTRIAELQLMANTLRKVPLEGAANLYEAMQSYLLLWQMMALEQSPNPFAFSVGNIDRILTPYYEKEVYESEITKGLFCHFLVFFNVGTRSWAISQNIIMGGKDIKGNDLTKKIMYDILDAYYEMNVPQPILSIKLHKNTPKKLYEALGKFFFTPGCLTPSVFNDEEIFISLNKYGIDKEDLEDYSIAGCQEPLIMGKDNGNTTNSWLNLGKVLEMTLNDGYSLLTNTKIGPSSTYFNKNITSKEDVLKNVRELFYQNLQYYIEAMVNSANEASKAISVLSVPFLSCFMGGVEYGYDMRNVDNQGTKYNASGCLVHGLSVIADSFIAIDEFLKQNKYTAENLIEALKENFIGYEDLKALLKEYPKYGNNINVVDNEAREIAYKVSQMIRSQKNYLGNSFRPDFSTPSTHLLYGYHVGATPDGRKAREMLGYGIDPLYGDATSGLGFRILSNYKLPFHEFNGGYASHLGINPKYFKGKTYEEKGLEFDEKIVQTLFYSSTYEQKPFYLYVNVTTAETLRRVLAKPEIYAPTGVYIMRIHGTFVNFLDLSPTIQEDIITRLDEGSSKLS